MLCCWCVVRVWCGLVRVDDALWCFVGCVLLRFVRSVVVVVLMC